MSERIVQLMKHHPYYIGIIIQRADIDGDITNTEVFIGDINYKYNNEYNYNGVICEQKSKNTALNQLAKNLYQIYVGNVLEYLIKGKYININIRPELIYEAYKILIALNPDLTVTNEFGFTSIQIAQQYYKLMVYYVNLAIKKNPDRKQHILTVMGPIINTYHDAIYMLSPNNQILLNQTLKSAKMGGNVQMLILEQFIGDEKIAADIVNANKSVSSISNL
jgi:hypothetical protein